MIPLRDPHNLYYGLLGAHPAPGRATLDAVRPAAAAQQRALRVIRGRPWLDDDQAHPAAAAGRVHALLHNWLLLYVHYTYSKGSSTTFQS